MSRIRLPIPESYWVIPGRFLAGEYPGGFNQERVRHRMDACLEAGLNTFINLTGPDELPPYLPVLQEQAKIHRKKVEMIHLPIRDFGLPTHAEMVNILNQIDKALEDQQQCLPALLGRHRAHRHDGGLLPCPARDDGGAGTGSTGGVVADRPAPHMVPAHPRDRRAGPIRP